MSPLDRCLAEMERADAELREATRRLIEEPGLLAIPDDVFARLNARETEIINSMRTQGLSACPVGRG